MFGIGMTEMIVIAVIALIFIGPDQIPEVARTVGRFLNDLRRSTDDIKRQFSESAGLPRDFNNIDQWTRPKAQIQPPSDGAGPVEQIADPHEGMNADQLRHDVEVPTEPENAASVTKKATPGSEGSDPS